MKKSGPKAMYFSALEAEAIIAVFGGIVLGKNNG